MKLEYRVLWFDNDPELFDSLEDEIEDMERHISGWGLIPQVSIVTDANAFSSYAPFSGIDLVVVDFNLEEHGHGQSFISQLRHSQVYTEVIFYSAQSAEELWDAVRKEQLEGVYIANKENVVPRILGVGEHTLKKVLDLENMRGIVMAEVGDLDILLDEIFRLGMEKIPPEKQGEIYARFHSDAKEHVTERDAALDEFLKGPSVEILQSLCDTSGARWKNHNRVKKQHAALKDYQAGDYQKEVITPRNALAHGIPRKDADGALIFEHRGATFKFDDQSSVALRHKIIEYRKIFTQMCDTLREV